MASTYPASLDTFATSSPTNLGDDDAQARNHAERHDDIGAAVNAIETELGTDPADAFATVAARLADAESRLSAQKSMVGNLLTDNQASGTDTLGTTEGFTSDGGATLSSTTGDPLTGARSLRAQATVATNASYVSCPSDQTIPVIPGQTMTLRAMIKTPSHTGEQWAARAEFIGATTFLGTYVLVNNIGYTEVAWTGVVPAGATAFRWHFRRMVGITGAVGYLDSLSLHVGAGGNWAMPGTPITGLGKHTNENGDIELWDDESAAWVGPYAEKATVGNLLTDNQASGTDTLGTTDGFTGYLYTRTSSTDVAYQGSRSLKAVATSASDSYVYVDSPSGSVTPGATYTATAALRTDQSSGEVGRIYIEWFTSVGGSLGNTYASSVTLSNASWTVFHVTAVAPATAAYARVGARCSGAAGAAMYVDSLGIWADAGGNWAMPGTPITGLGTRITRPNVDDRLVEQWNGSEWSVVGYDSGWRDVTASLLNGWTGLSLRIRRTLNDVQVIGAQLVAGTSNDIYTLPTGFHPATSDQFPFISLGSTQPKSWSDDTTQSVGVASGVNGATIRCVYTSAQATHRFSVILPVTAGGSAIPTSLPGTLVSSAPE